MKLVFKITIVFIAAMTLVLIERAWERSRREAAAYVDDMKRDHRVAGRVLRARLEELGPSPQQEEARARLIANANASEGSVRFEWSPLDRETALTPSQLAELSHGTEVQDLGSSELMSLFPTRVSGTTFGALTLRESLTEPNRHARTSMVSALVSVLLLTLAFSLLALGTGSWLVGRPVRRLVEKARRVGAGDLSGPLVLSSSDELGQLAKELNAMCVALGVARRELADETRARVEALEQLRHADRLATVGKLAAGVAHELGTPLSVVRGHAQMIAEREVLAERAVASARAIERESDRMGRFIRQLLDFARRREAVGAAADAKEVVERSLAMLEPFLDKHRTHVDLEIAAADLRVAIDADSLQQVVTNLAVNAVQAMEGGGLLEVAIAPVSKSSVRIELRDHGQGIPPDMVDQIFEPFFTTKGPGEGTGLGLSIAHGIVCEHGGRIEVQTEPGKGTTFAVVLPADRGAAS